LETQSIKAAVKGAVESIRKTPAVRRRKNVSYAVVVKVGYEEIQKLRNDGYSYDVICKMLSENGALDTEARPKNLCTAFLRETKRRLLRAQVNASTLKTSSAPVEKTEQEKEWTRKMTGTVVDTGLGTIIKHTDGSFEY